MAVTKMLLVLVFFFMLVGGGLYLTQSAAAPSPFEQCRAHNPSWFGCSTDAECGMIPDPCGALNDAANLQFKEKAKTCNVQAGAAIGCASLPNQPEMGAVCIENECRSRPRAE